MSRVEVLAREILAVLDVSKFIDSSNPRIKELRALLAEPDKPTWTPPDEGEIWIDPTAWRRY